MAVLVLLPACPDFSGSGGLFAVAEQAGIAVFDGFFPRFKYGEFGIVGLDCGQMVGVDGIPFAFAGFP
ncbi:hypothetical protein [Methylovulum psychrotolerans]|uniref:hypothetical protein n=1 Tax=Methylovulum psychrotolerans TaxID=1704499 RepID=UPI0018DF6458|nr:hypothetical protein [Methylovulum psychrotolerans]